ncbi:MAG: aminopeptidase [Candidatus Aminicenantes bacterium]|nr:aminopeptidase [Candidatus Aminicenantes bacterium]
MNKLNQAAERAVIHSLKLKKGENYLLITDKQKMDIAEAMSYWAKKMGAETTTYFMTETLRPIVEPTKLFRDMIAQADVVTYMLDARIEEKPFRGFMVKEGINNCRICMMPGITVDMMERLVNIDFKEMDAFTQRVIEAMNDADDVVVENPDGTYLECSVKGRAWKADNGDISQMGGHGNLPAGECFTAPVEESFSGKLVISLIDDKLGRGEMIFEKGTLVEYSGIGLEEIIRNIGDDKTGKIIGEFGIGTNPGAKICPNMLEAEKAFGTAHFAIGDSYGIGTNSSPHHYDALVNKITIKAKGRTIAKDGHFII